MKAKIGKVSGTDRGGVMKNIIACSILVFLLLLIIKPSSEGIRGDLNNNGEIDLAEAKYAWQVARGAYANIPMSCVLVGKGPWKDGKIYQLCDVVQYKGADYACNRTHTSRKGSKEPSHPTYWTLLDVNKPVRYT